MTDKDYSESAFREFLRKGAVAGIVKPATARSRKLAADQLLGELRSHERLDLRLVDVDELCARFHKLQGSTIRPENLQIYNQRLRGGLKDFFNWMDNPSHFESVDSEIPEARLVASRDTAGQGQAREELALNPPRSPYDIFPIPLREDLVVYLQNIPLNLSQREAGKICAVVMALAVADEKN